MLGIYTLFTHELVKCAFIANVGRDFRTDSSLSQNTTGRAVRVGFFHTTLILLDYTKTAETT